MITEIASYQTTKKIRQVHFQLWELELSPQNETTGRKEAIVTMKPDSDKPAMVKQQIKYTDFPLEYVKLYLIDDVLLLPSEY